MKNFIKKLLKVFIFLTLSLIAFCAYRAFTHPSQSEVKEKAELLLNYKFQDSVEVIKKSGTFWGGLQGDYSLNGTMILSNRDYAQVENILEAQMKNAKTRSLEDMTLPHKLEYQACADPNKKLCVEIWHPFEKPDETFIWSLNSSERMMSFEWTKW